MPTKDNPLYSLGKITTNAGTLVRITTNETTASDRVACHAVMIQALSTNTGKVYVFDRSTGSKVTFVGCLAILAVPSTNVIPSYSVGSAGSVNPFNAADIYIDVDNNGEGVIASINVF